MQTFDYIKALIESHYDMGEVVSIEQNLRGYWNVSYEVEALKSGRRTRCFLRRYMTGTPEGKVRFEHALHAELARKGFRLSPHTIATRDGAPYIMVPEPVGEGEAQSYFALFNFLEGEDKYCWNDPFCTSKELTSAARVLARFHTATDGWKYPGDWQEPRIIDRIPSMAQSWRVYAGRDTGTGIDDYLNRHLEVLSGCLKDVQECLGGAGYDSLAHIVIHGDYHPGNLKFADEAVVGVFDFDWAKLDARVMDVAFALLYFCVHWDEGRDGVVSPSRVEQFLQAYQEETATGAEGPGPLHRDELSSLPHMIQAANLYVLNWALDEFYTSGPDPDEYLAYIRHHSRTASWLKQNSSHLLKAVLKLSL